MSYGGYNQYGGNPYGGNAEEGAGNPYGAESNPYGTSSGGYGASAGGYGASNPYGASSTGYGNTGLYDPLARPAPSHATSGISATSDYGRPAELSAAQSPAPPVPAMPAQNGVQYQAAAPSSAPLGNQDFLARVEAVRGDIRQLTANISEIGTVHQRALGNPDTSASVQLENLVTKTQVLNTHIKDQIRFLEEDAAKSARSGERNTTKDSQIRTLKSSFKNQLQDYQNEEQNYRQRYREQIERQYRIVNPEATDAEVREAADADWGNEGVFQTALKSNRTGAAQSVLGSVRARHNDIQQIERTLIELNQLFQDLAEAVVLQEEPIKTVDETADKTRTELEGGNVQLDRGIKSAKRARKLRWVCFILIIIILCIVGLVVGLVVGLNRK